MPAPKMTESVIYLRHATPHHQVDGQHADTHNIIKLLIGSDVPGVPQVE